MSVHETIDRTKRVAVHAVAALALAAVAGCATDPWGMRDYATVIEQARKVGAGTVSPAGGAPDIQHTKESVTRPCVVDGKQVGTYTRTTNRDGAVSYSYSDDCPPSFKPAD